MSNSAKTAFYIGFLFLALTIINEFYAADITPSLQRVEILAGISSVGLMLVAFLWTEAVPKKNLTRLNTDKQGVVIYPSLNELIRNELGWCSQLLLTATPSSTILVYWDDKILIRRGILGNGNFEPGPTCLTAKKDNKLISLPNTKLFPGSYEFENIYKDLPSIIVYPLAQKGWLIIGGCSERCFSKSDEKWITGCGDRLAETLISNPLTLSNPE